MLQYNPSISGSLNITGSLIISNGMIGTVNGVDVEIFSSSISQVVTNIQTTTGSQSGRLTSIESFTSSVSTTNTFTASASTRLNSIETITASNVARLNAVETITSSNVARLNAVETITASNIARLTSLEITTGSLATTGSNTFIGTQTITGSLFISSNLVVQGTSSLQNITASAVSIGTNIVNLNTANPAIRYAGLVIGDSGSVGGSGSFLYDSVQDEMIFVHRGASSVVTSSVTLMGPETYDNVGSETYLTSNRIPKGNGNEHLGDSCIFDNGTTTCITNNLKVTGTVCFASSIDAATGITIGTSGTNDISWATAGGIKLSRTNIGPEYALSQRWTGTLAYIDIGASCQWNGGVTILPNGGGNVGIGTCTPVGKLDVALLNTRRFIVTYDDSTITIKGANDTGAGENLRVIGDNLIFNTNSVGSGTERMRITNTGISCFSCQVCVPNILISNCATIGTVGFSYPEFRLAVTPIMTVVGNGAGPVNEGIYFKRTSNLCQGGWISGNGGALYIIGQNKHSTAFGNIYFATNDGTTTCDIMVIDGVNQRVGVGTTTPYAKFEVLGGNQCPPSTGPQNYTMALRDPTSMVCGVGGSILFQGYKIGTANIGNFGYIAGKKENGTAGNEAGYISLGNFDSAGNVSERMRIGSVSSGGVVRIGTCAINWNTNSNAALQVAGAIRFGNPDGDYVASYGGGISARTLASFAPGSFAIIVKGLGGSGFLYQIQGFTVTGVRFTDLLFGINNTFSVISTVTENGPAARCYTITSENLNLCIGGSATYSTIVAHGFGAVER